MTRVSRLQLFFRNCNRLFVFSKVSKIFEFFEFFEFFEIPEIPETVRIHWEAAYGYS